jgi:hypothetical protein
MTPVPSDFFRGLVEHIAHNTKQHDAIDLALVHSGAAMTLDYFALQTIRAEPDGSHINAMAMSDCFREHAELFYADPEQQQAKKDA